MRDFFSFIIIVSIGSWKLLIHYALHLYTIVLQYRGRYVRNSRNFYFFFFFSWGKVYLCEEDGRKLFDKFWPSPFWLSYLEIFSSQVVLRFKGKIKSKLKTSILYNSFCVNCNAIFVCHHQNKCAAAALRCPRSSAKGIKISGIETQYLFRSQPHCRCCGKTGKETEKDPS